MDDREASCNALNRLFFWLNEQHEIIRVGTIPVLAGTGTIWAAVVVKESSSLLFSVASFIPFAAFTAIGALFSEFNKQSAESSEVDAEVLRGQIRLAIQQRDSAIASIQQVERCIGWKKDQLAGVIRRTEKLGSDVDPRRLLRAALIATDFNASITVINATLMWALHEHLKIIGRLGTGQLTLALLKPDETGEFVVLGDVRTTGGLREFPSRTGIFVTDEHAMAAQLWRSAERPNTSVLCTSDTRKSAEQGEFVFLHEQEEHVLLSMFAFRVANPVSGEPYGIWCIDCDQAGVFPDKSERTLILDLMWICKLFRPRLQMELCYSTVVDSIHPLTGHEESGKWYQMVWRNV